MWNGVSNQCARCILEVKGIYIIPSLSTLDCVSQTETVFNSLINRRWLWRRSRWTTPSLRWMVSTLFFYLLLSINFFSFLLFACFTSHAPFLELNPDSHNGFSNSNPIEIWVSKPQFQFN